MESQEAQVPTMSQGEVCASHTVFKSRVLWALLCGLFSEPIFFPALYFKLKAYILNVFSN